MAAPGDGRSGATPIATKLSAALNGKSGIALSLGPDHMDWRELARRVSWLDEALANAGIGRGSAVAIPGRNTFAAAISCVGLVATGRCAALVNPFQPAAIMFASARLTGAAAIVVDEHDLDPQSLEPDDTVFVVDDRGKVRQHSTGTMCDRAAKDQQSSLIMSTSGTTGDPKRIAIAADTLARAMDEIIAFHFDFGDRTDSTGNWRPLIQYSPLAHIGGTLTLLRGVAQGRRVELLHKFDPHRWADLLVQLQPFTTGLPPAMMRMVLDAAIDPSALSSLVSVWSGSAPVKLETTQTFTDRYGLPVLGNYGATEFCGPVATWSLDDYRSHHAEKVGATGRIKPSVASARVRAQNGGELLPPGEIGVLEMQVGRIGPEWLPTTDLAHIDADGFLYLHGRADDSIIRGGFKLAPDTIVQALRQHPLIRDASVVGIPHQRLGQVPVAAIELRQSDFDIAEADIIAFVKQRLPAYFVPVAIRTVAMLPRTPAMKLDRRAVRALFNN